MTETEKQIESILNRQMLQIHETHKRKIIQITGKSFGCGAMALCDDGTLWNIYWESNHQKWVSEQIPYEIDD